MWLGEPQRTSSTDLLAVGAPRSFRGALTTYPDAGRYLGMIRPQVSVFYTDLTAIRSLIKANEASGTHPTKYNLSGACASSAPSASPINPKPGCGTTPTWAWRAHRGYLVADRNRWSSDHALPGVTPTVPGSCTLPLPGIMRDRRRDGHDVPNGRVDCW